jgi:hypothetical protein
VGVTKRYLYTEDNIKSMEANNPNGVFDVLIAETRDKFDTYKGNTSESKINEALRIAYTAETGLVMSEIRLYTTKCEGLVKSIFTKNSPDYLKFLPFGLSEFHDANPAEMLDLLDRNIAFNTDYKTQLGTNLYIDKFAELKTKLSKAVDNQKEAGSKVKSKSEIKEILWNELKKQLYKNMLFIALHYIDNLAMVLTYFKPQLLRTRKNSDKEIEQTYTLSIAPASSKAADISFSVDDTLLIINNGDVPLYYYATTAADSPQPAQLSEIAIGDEAEVAAAQLGAPANKFLIFVNKDAAQQAEVEIAMI